MKLGGGSLGTVLACISPGTSAGERLVLESMAVIWVFCTVQTWTDFCSLLLEKRSQMELLERLARVDIAVTIQAVPVLPSCGCVARRECVCRRQWVAAGGGGFTECYSWVAWGGHVDPCSPCCRNPCHKVMSTASVEVCPGRCGSTSQVC